MRLRGSALGIERDTPKFDELGSDDFLEESAGKTPAQTLFSTDFPIGQKRSRDEQGRTVETEFFASHPCALGWR